jgi:hypothetical protein
MDLLMRYHFAITVDEITEDEPEVRDQLDHDFVLAVIPGAGGEWSDHYSFKAGYADSYFQALDQAVASSLEKEQKQVRKTLDDMEF